MDIKYKPDGSVVIKPTKTELKQAEATMGMMQGIAANTECVAKMENDKLDLCDHALRCVDDIRFVLADLNSGATAGNSADTDTDDELRSDGLRPGVND